MLELSYIAHDYFLQQDLSSGIKRFVLLTLVIFLYWPLLWDICVSQKHFVFLLITCVSLKRQSVLHQSDYNSRPYFFKVKGGDCFIRLHVAFTNKGTQWLLMIHFSTFYNLTHWISDSHWGQNHIESYIQPFYVRRKKEKI